jgi:nucleoside-diphosphate-sugar epimerase
MENLGNYYKSFYNLDFRSIRYVGVISPMEFAYNGSTDYATEIFFKARNHEKYSICLSENRRLPMCYIDDIIGGTLKFIEAPHENLTMGSYNINGCHFDPKEMVDVIRDKYYPGLEVDYVPELRDSMSKNWPYHYDDSASRADWGWNPQYNTIEKIAEKMYNKTKLEH